MLVAVLASRLHRLRRLRLHRGLRSGGDRAGAADLAMSQAYFWPKQRRLVADLRVAFALVEGVELPDVSVGEALPLAQLSRTFGEKQATIKLFNYSILSGYGPLPTSHSSSLCLETIVFFPHDWGNYSRQGKLQWTGEIIAERGNYCGEGKLLWRGEITVDRKI